MRQAEVSTAGLPTEEARKNSEYFENYLCMTLSGCGRSMPADTEGSSEYVKKTVVDNRQGVVIKPGGWVRGLTTTHHKKGSMLRKVIQGRGLL
jgi:hypothetical protein